MVIVSENGEVVGQSEGQGSNPWVTNYLTAHNLQITCTVDFIVSQTQVFLGKKKRLASQD